MLAIGTKPIFNQHPGDNPALRRLSRFFFLSSEIRTWFKTSIIQAKAKLKLKGETDRINGLHRTGQIEYKHNVNKQSYPNHGENGCQAESVTNILIYG